MKWNEIPIGQATCNSSNWVGFGCHHIKDITTSITLVQIFKFENENFKNL